MSENASNLSFEEAYTQLQDVAAQLESGDLSLDESVALYEQGQTLARLCGSLLDAAELRIQQIDDAGALGPLAE